MAKFLIQKDLNDPTKLKIEERTDADENTVAELPVDLIGEEIESLTVSPTGVVTLDPVKKAQHEEAKRVEREAKRAEREAQEKEERDRGQRLKKSEIQKRIEGAADLAALKVVLVDFFSDLAAGLKK